QISSPSLHDALPISRGLGNKGLRERLVAYLPPTAAAVCVRSASQPKKARLAGLCTAGDGSGLLPSAIPHQRNFSCRRGSREGRLLGPPPWFRCRKRTYRQIISIKKKTTSCGLYLKEMWGITDGCE